MILPPPSIQSLKAGTQLRAGHGVSTIVADFDFETYSEAGYVWSNSTNKWWALRGANDKGLFAVGAARYSEHPSTEVLSLAYDLKDGMGIRHWHPNSSDVALDDLFAHVRLGGLFEAWNVSFEYLIWMNVCVKKYGFSPLNPGQLRCAMAKARAYSLPGALANAGMALNISEQKDKSGVKLLDKFSKPRNPSKADPRTRILPTQYGVDAKDTHALYEYNKQDIRAEAELSSLIPDLSEFELKFWLCDQAINNRGVHIDLKSIEGCMSIVEQAHKKYNAELRELTLGAVNSASEVMKLQTWINSQDSVHIDKLDADTVDYLLANDIPKNVRRALEIRQLIGSAAVKKLYSMANQVCADGRLRGLFIYHSARTGRAAGAGPRPQNLPNSGPIVKKCTSCSKYQHAGILECKWCGYIASLPPEEWNIDALEDALTVINTQSLACVESYFGDSQAAVSGCLRGLFTAAPGHDLICSDYSAIEAVVLAELAGEPWRQEVFRTHGKIYESSASKITGIPFEEFERVKKETGSHHPMRKLGKTAELACLAPHTLVITERGYKFIHEILPEDKLWDGEEYVPHEGIVSKGLKHVVNLDGVSLTRNHPISYTDGYFLAAEDFGKIINDKGYACIIPNDSYLYENALDYAKKRTPYQYFELEIQFCEIHYPIKSAVEVYDILNCGPRNRFMIKTRSGHFIVHNSGYGGWIGAWKRFGADEFLTEEKIKQSILAWRDASPNIVNLWGGQKRGWTSQLFGLEGCAIQAILSPGKEFNYRGIKYQVLDDVLYCTLLSGRKLVYHKPRVKPHIESRRGLAITFEGWNSNPAMGPLGWVTMDTYSGKLCENVVQATARDILAYAIVNLERAKYPVVLHIHDEAVSEVPEGFGSVEEFESIMSTMPEWAKDWPIKAKGGWRERGIGNDKI